MNDQFDDVFWVTVTDDHSGQQFVGEVAFNTDDDQWDEVATMDDASPYNWGNQYAGHLNPDQVVRIMSKYYDNGYTVTGPFDTRPNRGSVVGEAVRVFGHTGPARGALSTMQRARDGGSAADQAERNRLAQFARSQRNNGGVNYDQEYRSTPNSRTVKRSMVSDVDERTGQNRVLGIIEKLKQYLKPVGARISEVTPITPSHYKFRIRTEDDSNHAGIFEVFKKFQNVIEKGGGSMILDPKLTRGAVKLVGMPSFSRSVDQSIR